MSEKKALKLILVEAGVSGFEVWSRYGCRVETDVSYRVETYEQETATLGYRNRYYRLEMEQPALAPRMQTVGLKEEKEEEK